MHTPSPPPGSPAASPRAVYPTTHGTDRPLIGRQWMPRQRIRMSADDERVQRAVLAMRQHRVHRQRVGDLLTAVVGAAIAAALYVWGGL